MADNPGSTREGDESEAEGGLTTWQVTKSVLWAFIGIQKDETRRRDLSRGKPHQFIIIGLAATVLFILAVSGVVSVVLSLAGA